MAKTLSTHDSRLSGLLGLLCFPSLSAAAPLHQLRNIESIGYIDPSTDEWSSTLSGIGPLILLVGERSTKQVLRNVRGIYDAFSLAAAPLGLLSVVTSLIRFCGTQRLRAFIGYELEARTVAGIEVTRVNCAGVHAHFTDGYIVRSIAANPMSRLIAVSILQGEERDLSRLAIDRIRECERFEGEKAKRKIPQSATNSEWCLHITGKVLNHATWSAIIQTLTEAIGIIPTSKYTKLLQKKLKPVRGNGENAGESSAGPSEDEIERTTSATMKSKRDPKITITLKSRSSSQCTDGELSQTYTVDGKKRKATAPFWNFTFMSTFDAVSEFTTGKSSSKFASLLIGIISFLAIVAIHILALWENYWIVSIAWILMVLGYLGIVIGVVLATLLINSSCQCIKLKNNSPPSTVKTSPWTDGMVVAVKNTDSMDVTGSSFFSSTSKFQTLEAVWIKQSAAFNRLYATAVTLFLVFAFLAHYLGLRAVIWWAGIGELVVCIVAAFARSVSNDAQPRFEEVKGIKIDKRCTSTGVIKTTAARLVDRNSHPATLSIDARAYSQRSLDNAPTVGERVAYEAAKLCLQDAEVASKFLSLTGMKLHIVRAGQPESFCAVFASFANGVLVTEGLAFPTSAVLIAFRAKISDLAAPTSLLVRAIMRQPEWKLERGFPEGIPLGNVYIFAMQSMLEWWTLSEDRNDLGDLQSNFHWPIFLINTAFFILLLEMTRDERDILEELEKEHEGDREADMEVAEGVVRFVKEKIVG
ncbi:hypothetical protein G7Y89_g9449 [Cudoniella acicularis]|uniref:Uncharacterized protein n=1 Tax=Cudoniella acicularis TaxID=354080 RepID=A0A8H4REM8_9HELO|nr:hypothetical protein G7Y89_g9449 [Cudoniella acicularis]